MTLPQKALLTVALGAAAWLGVAFVALCAAKGYTPLLVGCALVITLYAKETRKEQA